MTQKKLHPSVLKFKEFVKNNPKLIQEVRKGKATWQELYEDWYLLGEEDKRWESVGTTSSSEESKAETSGTKGDFLSNILGMAKKMDPNQMQAHLANISQALGAIQGLISQFQGTTPPGPGQVNPPEGPKHPFSFRQD
ncbi:YlbD family protein [Neobacillus dielmonensis]|uniref:YlbD family protein n=1 Tax=Neobacillus dielmonensis TaxID=1347369 RepID=UPI0005A82435|nr:YlbD family protein [Neobacillus dielmonensis]